MKYGYARVSTLHQDLESQLQALEKEIAIKFTQISSLERKRIGHILMSCFRY